MADKKEQTTKTSKTKAKDTTKKVVKSPQKRVEVKKRTVTSKEKAKGKKKGK